MFAAHCRKVDRVILQLPQEKQEEKRVLLQTCPLPGFVKAHLFTKDSECFHSGCSCFQLQRQGDIACKHTHSGSRRFMCSTELMNKSLCLTLLSLCSVVRAEKKQTMHASASIAMNCLFFLFALFCAHCQGHCVLLGTQGTDNYNYRLH